MISSKNKAIVGLGLSFVKQSSILKQKRQGGDYTEVWDIKKGKREEI
jgi:hypothetical protein